MSKLIRLQNFIVVGITGVGKTTVGRALAEAVGLEFVDLDKSIENRYGVDIPTIFEIEGEKGFRKRETDELKRICKSHDNFVLSVGGGCIIRAENRKLIANSANVVIQLYAGVDSLVERLAKSAIKRPLLLNDADVAKKLTELYESRKEYYDMITDFKIDTSALKPNQVVDEIMGYLRAHKILLA